MTPSSPFLLQLRHRSPHLLLWAAPSFLIMGETNSWYPSCVLAMIAGILLFVVATAGILSRHPLNFDAFHLKWALRGRSALAILSLLGICFKIPLLTYSDFVTGIPAMVLTRGMSSEPFFAVLFSTLAQAILIGLSVAVMATFLYFIVFCLGTLLLPGIPNRSRE